MDSSRQPAAAQASPGCVPPAVDSRSGGPAPAANQRWAGARRLGLRGILFVWMPLLILGLGSLMASHWAALPRPSLEEPHLAETLAVLGAQSDLPEPPIHAYHVLDGACRCSQRIAKHLMDSKRPAGAAETVLLLGANESLQEDLERSGFDVCAMDREEAAAALGFTSVPLLLVTGRLANGAPTLRYSGGYTARQQALTIQDTVILTGLIHGSTPDSLPVFGCGTTATLQAALDPLGIKY